MRRRIKDYQWLTCPRKGRMVLNNSFHSREADPHVIKNPPSGNGCCETAEHFTYTGYLSSRSVKAVTSMATFSLVHNILHTTPTHHHLSSSLYWDGKLPGVVSLFRAHIVPLLLLVVVAWWRGAGKLCPVQMTSDESFLKSFIFLRN